MSRRPLIALAMLVAALAVLAVPGARAAAPEWHSEQPVAAGIEVPVALGQIGDIEFWAPNRGLLITAGNHGAPAGIYAYDGSGWHLYSTVCGGQEGRIAWAGPDEFWTISDQAIGEENTLNPVLEETSHRSLCHFKNGEVVASYAEPLGRATSFSPMDAAVCEGPNNCWFGGERLPGNPNAGAFHLHWNGTTLQAVPSLTEPEPKLKDPGRSVFGLAFNQGKLYESLDARSGDQAPTEKEPFFFHRVELTAQEPFAPVPTPAISDGGEPEGLEGFRFATEGSTLWALSGDVEEGGTVPTTLLHLASGAFRQVALAGGPLVPGTRIYGWAFEPGAHYAWASFGPARFEQPGVARLARVQTNGQVGEEIVLPAPGEELDPKGTAGPVACPASGQCWMATSMGWLFHLGGPPAEGVDTDPAMHQLITFRPEDGSARASIGAGAPEDDSGAEVESHKFPEAIPFEPPLEPRVRKRPPLYAHVKQKVLHHTVLQLTFVLNARAHVQLLAKRHKAVVAKTARLTLGKGKHKLRLRLDPKRWPTGLDFQVHALKGKAAK
jgi:hypothetical protein